MPVEAQTAEYSYVGDGVTVAFPFPARFLSNGDILVGVNGVEQTGGVTISGAGGSGGTVTFAVAPALGAVVALIRRPPTSQLVDFVNGQTVFENVLDNGLDKLTMICQYLMRGLNRTLRLSEFDTSTVAALPGAATRANGLLGFDAAGGIKVFPDFSGSTAPLNLLGEIVSVSGLDMAALNAAGARAAANNDVLNIDVPIAVTGGFAPGYPDAPALYRFWPNGKFTQAGVGGATFVAPIEAGRWPIFDGFVVTSVTNQLSLYPGTNPLVEWFKWTGEMHFGNALSRAMKSANNAVASLDVGTYEISTTGAGDQTAATANRSQTGLVGKGRDRTTIIDKSFYMDTGSKVAANAAITLAGTNITAGGSHIVNPKIGGFKLVRDDTVTSVGGFGLSLVYTARAELFDMQIEGYLGGVYLQRCTNATLNDIHVHFPGPANHPVAGTPLPYVGFLFDGDGTLPGTPGVALGNASSIGYRLAVSADNPNTASKGLHIRGGYVGDLHFEYFDTQGLGVGIHLDLTGTFVDTNGNADIIFDYLHLDGIRSVAMLVDGDTDNNSLWTVKSGWVNVTGGVGTLGYYVRNGKGGNLDLGQSGIGGRGVVYALKVENHAGLVASNGQFKDAKRAFELSGALLCDVGTGTLIRNVPAHPLQYGAYLHSGASYNTVRLDTFSGTCDGALLLIAAGANNYNEVFIGKFDTSAMAQHNKHGVNYPLVATVGAGATGNRIHYAGPDTHISDAGTGTLVWSDWAPYAAATVTCTGGGAFADVTATVSYKREGEVCRVKGSIVIGAAGIGTATGVPIVTLPVASLTALSPVIGLGYTSTTGAFPTGAKWMNPTIAAGELRLYLQDGSSAIANGTTLEFDVSYRTA